MKKNQIIKFLKRLILLFIILIVVDFCIGKLLEKSFFNKNWNGPYNTTYTINKTRADMLVFGSSRANHHYVPLIFSDSLNLSFYNCGRDGSFILYHEAMLKCILRRYIPKFIILDLNIGEFDQVSGSYDRLSALLPYFPLFPEIGETLLKRGPFEKYKLFSRTYPYNSLILEIIAANMHQKPDTTFKLNGYLPLHKVWGKNIEKISLSQEIPLDTNKINAYKSFISLCCQNKIKLCVVISPIFYQIENKDNSIELAKTIADKNVLFFDFSQDREILHGKNNFQDIQHLNNTGAMIFSGKLAQLIKRTLVD